MNILTPRQMADCEAQSERCGVSLATLMDGAGNALAECLRKLCYERFFKKALFLCGNGNNGGDGFVAAEILAKSGISASVMLCMGEPKTELAKSAFGRLSDDVGIVEKPDYKTYDVICDCIFGTGFRGSLPQNIAEILCDAGKTDSCKIACDLPSGVNALTGEADKNVIRFDMTVSFHAPKLGTYLSPAKYLCGENKVCDIGIPDEADCNKPITLLTEKMAREMLPYRKPYGHKGTFGRVLAVCGSGKYIGAGAMSTMSALRSGAGLVNLCTAKSVAAAVAQSVFEAVYTPLPEENGCISGGYDELQNAIALADCVLIGCGLQNNEYTKKLLQVTLSCAECPVVIDADGINCLSENIDILKSTKANVLLTPHPMELARLCGLNAVPQDRYSLAAKLCEDCGVTVMSKAAETIIVSDTECYLTNRGNTALSKGGSGDVLAGITASLIAQGMEIPKACAVASFVLGRSAEMLTETRSERGVIARDIIETLPEVFFNLEK